MKNYLLTLLAITAMVTVSNAQTEKTDWLVGGNMTINTTEGNSQFTLQPSAGYFFARNFAAGGQVTLSFAKQEDTKYSSFSIGPFARYYFDIRNSPFKPFLHADLNFGSTAVKDNFGKTSTTTTSFFIGAGGAYFINSNVALEALAGYNRTKIETYDPTNGFLFRIGFQVHLLGAEVARVRGK